MYPDRDRPTVDPSDLRKAFACWFAHQAARMGSRGQAASRLRRQLTGHHEEVLTIIVDAVFKVPKDQGLSWLEDEAASKVDRMISDTPYFGGVRPSVTIDEVIGVLNEAVQADPVAMTALVNARVPCNDVLAHHPTIQCGSASETGCTRAPVVVGLLGMLNGLFGIFGEDDPEPTGFGAIAANIDDDGIVKGFMRVTPKVQPA